ncbi:cytochrome C assembly protein [Caenimonas koreensis DSM 17982]|uniref:Cytochrome C assembly protein n=1 Tax=Caenimonas koreensis DSM 17982 TaxID=1121255 RepID=A0A844AW28_9BURK|nr:cytochrome c biogenesis protein CcsA [Caenimonas koreensis]MRD48294.1 cytochrome C assembly protein [Caenimonas koreensis DSM 17982]
MILASASAASMVMALSTAAAYAVPAVGARHLSNAASRLTLIVAWLLHASVLAWGLMGETPRFGFAPALSVTAWLVLTVYAIEREMFPQLEARWAVASLGAAAVILAMVFPGSELHSASPWLPLHWALGISSYGLIAAAVIHAWLMTRAERSIRAAADPRAGLPLLTLERLTFRFAMAGFVLLSATLAAGIFFSETIYGPGHGMKWDHKAVFSVLAWLVFATLLVGRWKFGWRGRRAVRWLYIGSILLLLGYAGSRFVLEVILGRTSS